LPHAARRRTTASVLESFPLASLLYRGRRGRERARIEPVDFAGLTFDAGAVEALHHSLHGLLVLLFVAGYELDGVVLGAASESERLDVGLSGPTIARSARGDFDGAIGGATLVVFVPLTPRAGPAAIDHGLTVSSFGGGDWLVVEVATASHDILSQALGDAIDALRPTLLDSIEAAHQVGGDSAGLLRIYDPGEWAYPAYGDSYSPSTKALAALGAALQTLALGSPAALRTFLDQESPPREGGHDGAPHSVKTRLREQLAEPLSRRDARKLMVGFKRESRATWRAQNEEGRPPQRMSDLRKLTWTEVLFDAQNQGTIDVLGALAETYAIYPAIGIARVGNHASAYFIGPEEPGKTYNEDANGERKQFTFRQDGLLKRQGARFGVYRHVKQAEGEMTTTKLELGVHIQRIEWQVRLANRKADSETHDADTPFRNDGIGADHGNRTGLWLEAEASLASDDAVAERDLTINHSATTGDTAIDDTKRKITSLGRLVLKADGRLVLLGGRGISVGVTESIARGVDNDAWFDDTSDGWVKATITLSDGRVIDDVQTAWCLVGPPNHAPDQAHVTTLYDRLYDLAVREHALRPDLFNGASWPGIDNPASAAYDPGEVQTILDATDGMKWVNQRASAVHANITDVAMARAERARIVSALRLPYALDPQMDVDTPEGMPPLYFGQDKEGRSLTLTQYAIIKAWAGASTTHTTAGEVNAGAEVTRAALESCTGAALAPGVECSVEMLEAEWLLDDFYAGGSAPTANPFRFRLDPDNNQPGVLTKRLAVPWQADFYNCKELSENVWWPAVRPDQVRTSAVGDPGWRDWHEGIPIEGEGDTGPTMVNMKDRWWELGFVVEDEDHPGIYIEKERVLQGSGRLLRERYSIYPAIGIARVGNHPTDYFIGPEIPGQPYNEEANGPRADFTFKKDGMVRRQGARFRVYRHRKYESGDIVSLEMKLDSSLSDIAWSVHLANRKYDTLEYVDTLGQPRERFRNQDEGGTLGNRQDLWLSASEESTPSSGARVELELADRPFDSLGTLVLEPDGRLVVLGGYGEASGTGSPTNVDNDGWNDDVSDGTVMATVTLADGAAGPVPQTPEAAVDHVEAAWCIVGPPDYAPEHLAPTTLYDRLYDWAVRHKSFNPALFSGGTFNRGAGGYVPNLGAEVDSILAAAKSMNLVNTRAISAHFSFEDATAPEAVRALVLSKLTIPLALRSEGDGGTGGNMPPLRRRWDEEGGDLTPSQYVVIEQWANAGIADDATVIATPTEVTPDGLTRAALDHCNGAGIDPGIECSLEILDGKFVTPDDADGAAVDDFFTAEAPPRGSGNHFRFRLDPARNTPGDFTKQLAVPWQTDFYSCKDNGNEVWWPASRPDQVFLASGESLDWDRGVTQESMVTEWSKLGYVVGGVEDERNL
jgi:L-Lysine epsilon oxidase N-terminal/L-lysine epsilon oxidase C-terminal domain